MSDLASINAEQGLYVIHAGRGYSCLGFEYGDSRARKVAAWCGVTPPQSALGTAEHYAEIRAILAAGAAHHLKTGERCPAELSPQLAGLEGKRVEVVDRWDNRRRFYVGKSMGWLPCHLEIARRDSIGGGATLGDPFKSVRVVAQRGSR